MTCDESIERLPWFLNGTLEEGERDEVHRHLATCEACRTALKDTREAWAVFDQHLPSETLVALAYGETPPGGDSALAERHLATCPQCAAELELARMSRRLEEDDKVALFPGPKSLKPEVARDARTWRAAALAAGLTAAVAASGWFYQFQQAGYLAEQLTARKETPAPQSRPSEPVGSSGQIVAELQAKLDGLSQEQEKLNHQLSETQQSLKDQVPKARANAWSGLLIPAGDIARSENGAGPEKILPANVDAVITLGTDNQTPGDRDIEVLDQGGHVWLTLSGLHNQDSQYKFSLPAGLLERGRYNIRLYPFENGRRGKAETYTITVK
jgi:anti-sigma factor RsiW